MNEKGRIYPEIKGVGPAAVIAAILAYLGWEPFLEDGLVKFRPDRRGARELSEPREREEDGE